MGVDQRELLGTVFEDYRQWCAQSNRHPLGMQRFKGHLLITYPALDWGRKLHGRPAIYGLALIPAPSR